MLSSLRNLRARSSVNGHINYLVAFGDTEGATEKNGLWSMTLLITAVVSGPATLSSSKAMLPRLSIVKHCYHALNFNGQEGMEKATGKAVCAHFDMIAELKQEYDARGVLLCFWNAAHDKKQIEPYQDLINQIPQLNVQYVDMLHLVRELVKFPKYNLNYLRYQVYGSETEKKLGAKQTHSSLYDTLDMIYVVCATILDSACEEYVGSSSYQEREERPKQIHASIDKTTRKQQMQVILTHEFFLIGLIENPTKKETKNKIKRNVSFDLIPIESSVFKTKTKEKYQYFSIDNQEFKVRVGFEDSNSVWYKGFGLYVLKGAQYKRILDKKRKKAILDMLVALSEKRIEESEASDTREGTTLVDFVVT